MFRPGDASDNCISFCQLLIRPDNLYQLKLVIQEHDIRWSVVYGNEHPVRGRIERLTHFSIKMDKFIVEVRLLLKSLALFEHFTHHFWGWYFLFDTFWDLEAKRVELFTEMNVVIYGGHFLCDDWVYVIEADFLVFAGETNLLKKFKKCIGQVEIFLFGGSEHDPEDSEESSDIEVRIFLHDFIELH